MVFDFNTLGNAEGFIYEPWHWALEAVHRFAITDSPLKAIGLRLVSSYSEPRRKPHRLDTNSPLPDPKSFHEKAGLLRDAIRSQCLTCSRHKKRSPGFSSLIKAHVFTDTVSLGRKVGFPYMWPQDLLRPVNRQRFPRPLYTIVSLKRLLGRQARLQSTLRLTKYSVPT